MVIYQPWKQNTTSTSKLMGNCHYQQVIPQPHSRTKCPKVARHSFPKVLTDNIVDIYDNYGS